MRVPVLVITRYGGPEVIEVQEKEVQPPGPGEVRVDVLAAGINFAEVFCRLGLYKLAPKPPFVPGFEFAGVVVDAGPGAAWAPGDRVMGVSRFGSYAGGLTAQSDRLRAVPEGWSFAEAAGFPAAALTAAYGLLELGRLRAGERVLIHSAAGGVGSTAVQLARARGAYVVGTVGRAEKLPVLETLGVDLPLVRGGADWVSQVREHTGELDIVFDAIGGAELRRGYRLLAPRGRLVSYGMGSMTPTGRRPNYLKLAWQVLRNPRISVFDLIGETRSVAGFNVLRLWDRLDVLGPYFDECVAHARAGELRTRMGEVAPYTEVGRLHAALQSGQTTGKLVLEFPATTPLAVSSA